MQFCHAKELESLINATPNGGKVLALFLNAIKVVVFNFYIALPLTLLKTKKNAC